MTLLQILNQVSRERSFDDFIKLSSMCQPETVKLAIKEAENRFKKQLIEEDETN